MTGNCQWQGETGVARGKPNKPHVAHVLNSEPPLQTERSCGRVVQARGTVNFRATQAVESQFSTAVGTFIPLNRQAESGSPSRQCRSRVPWQYSESAK